MINFSSCKPFKTVITDLNKKNLERFIRPYCLTLNTSNVTEREGMCAGWLDVFEVCSKVPAHSRKRKVKLDGRMIPAEKDAAAELEEARLIGAINVLDKGVGYSDV